MKFRYMLPLFIAAFLVQSTLLNELRLFGVTPNLILCLVAVFSFWFDGPAAAGLGIFFGLLQDLCFGELIGTAALVLYLISQGIRMIKHLFYRDNLLSVFFISLLSTAVYELVYWLIQAVMGGTAHILYMLSILPLLLIYNCLATVVMYLIFRRRLIKHPRDRYV